MIRWLSPRLFRPIARRKVLFPAALAGAGIAVFFVFSPLRAPDVRFRLFADYSVVHLGEDGKLLRLGLSPSGKFRISTAYEEFSSEIRKGAVAYEDRWFRWHPGINPAAVIRALAQNSRAGRTVSGASTISMQIAKMANPGRRNLRRKMLDAWMALDLELRFSKREILELYLNMVPMGGNIEGVGAASYLYFGKPPSLLSWGEVAMLIGIPRSPEKFRPDRFPQEAKNAGNRVLSVLRDRIPLSSVDYAWALTVPAPVERIKNPHDCPHLVMRFDGSNGLGESKFVRQYRISNRVQGICEELMKRSANDLKKYGIFNGAILVVDNKTMDVLAYVGSPDWNNPNEGQIDGCRILRSPGSALKPFLYLRAIEKGKLTPRSILYDIPRAYRGFSPVNYELTYAGPVTTMRALVDSFNVPAVHLDSELGDEGLLSVLSEAGIRGKGREKLDPGLSAVLGSYPLSLEEMVGIYAALANDGRVRPLRYFADSVRSKGRRIFAPEACYVMAEMLSNNERPDLPLSWEFTASRGRVAFKTGTSFGFRDAWAVGFNPDYTVGVWVGNATAIGVPEIRSRTTAAPILIEVFNSLTRQKDSWFKMPEGVVERRICAESGKVPGKWCSNIGEDLAIIGRSDTRKCDVHARIFVRKADGAEVCYHCMTGKPAEYEERVVEMWPSEVCHFLRATGRKYERIPPHNGKCMALAQGRGPKIISPVSGITYALSAALDESMQMLPLQVQTASDGEDVFWFVEGKCVAQGKSSETFFWPTQPGDYMVSVIDSRGRFDKVAVSIQSKLAEDRG